MNATATAPKVHTIARSYLLTFTWSGHSYPLSSEEAQRLIDEYPLARKPRPNRIDIRNEEQQVCTITPTTLGGGPAFTIA